MRRPIFRQPNPAQLLETPKPGMGQVRRLPGGCVMLRHERSPVSRVREIRMHGLKGGLALTPALEQEGK